MVRRGSGREGSTGVMLVVVGGSGVVFKGAVISVGLSGGVIGGDCGCKRSWIGEGMTVVGWDVVSDTC